MKKYTDYMDELTADELYKGLLAHGMMTDKLPPIFTTESFYNYCLSMSTPFQREHRGYISFETMRNLNIPREMSIPNPMAYQKLCEGLRDNWENLKQHFHNQTDLDPHIVSRIHIRKMKDTDSLFDMNYDNWKVDGSPQDDLLMGNRYVVHADISTCFPSIYSHAICWALAGKDIAKANKGKSTWYNDIDGLCQAVRNGETHGLMIGPHTSNLLSETILTVIDHRLVDNHWKFTRHIDDYTCYVSSYEEAQKFLNELNSALKDFDLPMNHKKTSIKLLPVATAEHWIRKLNCFSLVASYGKVSYVEAKGYFDLAVELMEKNSQDSAILKYAVKVLARQNLTDNAKKFILKECTHLAIIYPYLLPLMDEFVFKMCGANKDQIQNFTNTAYSESLKSSNYEGICYSIYYALKYDFQIVTINYDDILKMNSCLARLFGMIYYKKFGNSTIYKKFRDDAKTLRDTDMDQYWLYIYETLTHGNLKGEWRKVKEAGVSFLKSEFRF